MQQKIVITGGPGTGKTMVINELINRGHKCMLEISRKVTLDAREKGIAQLFLTDPLLFSQMLLEGRIEQYLEAKKLEHKTVFFDRGIPDVHSYLDCTNTEYPDIYIESSHKYKYSHVFLMPPWEDIYVADNERFETYEESLKIYHFIKKAYTDLGYTIVEVPHGTIDDRTDFILESLK